jgi:hypothetical protein
MAGIRALIRARWSGRLLAAGAAGLLVLQTLIASVGLGMSAASPFGQQAFDICSAAATDSVNAPAHNNDGTPNSRHPQCLFCLFAAQCASHPATVGDARAFPAFAVDALAAPPYDALNYHAIHGRLHRTTGDPRGPPSFPI